MGNVIAMYLVMEDSISSDFQGMALENGTHIYCGHAELNPTTYHAVIPREKHDSITSFPTIAKKAHPNIKLLLSIGNIDGSDVETFARMVMFPSRRRSLINSSIELAKKYNYDGFEIHWLHPSTETEMTNFGLLVKEWREAIRSELTLVATVYYSPFRSPNNKVMYPCIDMDSSLDWINIAAYDFYTPESSPHQTGPSHAFFNPIDKSLCGEFGLEQWVKVFPVEKIVYSFATYGWAWKLKNSNENGIFAAAEGPYTDLSSSHNGLVENAILNEEWRSSAVYSEEFMVNYFHSGNTWITYESPISRAKPIFVPEKYGTLGIYFFYFKSNDPYSKALVDEGMAEWKRLKEEKKV